MNPDLQKYIQDSRSSGLSEQQIEQALLQSGWSQEAISAELHAGGSQTIPAIPTELPRTSSRKKIIAIILGTILLVLIASGFFIPQVLQVQYVRLFGAPGVGEYDQDLLSIVPIKRDILVQDLTSGQELAYKDIQFEVPLSEAPSLKEGSAGNSLTFIFNDGKKSLTFFQEQSLFEEAKEVNYGPQALKVLMSGSPAINSDYDYLQSVLAFTPRDLNFSFSNDKAITKLFLLLEKIARVTSHSKSGIFSFDTQNIKGFQMTDPSKEVNSAGKSLAVLELFDIKGKGRAVLIANGFDQKEIDFIISSVRFID